MRLISCNERQKKKHHTISILDHLNVIKAIKCIYMFVFYNRNFNHFDELALNKEIRTKRQTPQSQQQQHKNNVALYTILEMTLMKYYIEWANGVEHTIPNHLSLES